MIQSDGKPRFIRKKQRQPLWPVGLFLLVTAVVVLVLFWPRKTKGPDQPPPPAVRSVTSESAQPPAPATAADSTPALPEEAETSTDEPAAPIDNRIRELLSEARQAVLSGDHDRAEQLFRKLVEADPGIAYEFGAFLFRRGKFKEAVEYLEQALPRVETPAFEVRKFLALAYYQLNRLPKCSEMIREALPIRPDKELQNLADRLSRELRLDQKYGNIDNTKFQLLFNGREHAGIKRAVLDILNEAYRTIGQRFDYYPPGPISVILYTETDFYTVTQSPVWAGGLFDGKIRLPARGALDEVAELRRVLFHEYTHAMIYSLTPVCPLWIHEGLAEFFSQDQVPRVGQVFPLHLLERGFPSGSLNAILTAYQESHQAVADLISRFGVFRVKQLLQELGAGKSLEEAFQAAFIRPYQAYIESWGR